MSQEPPDHRASNHRIWAVALVAIIAIFAATGLYLFQSLRDLPGDAIDQGRALVGDLRDLASAFSQGTVETTFLSYATRVSGSNYLQFAALEQIELFRRRDEASLLWGRLELPELVVEATAPVEYTYYLDLDGEWKFHVDEDRRTVTVLAPEIRFNRPAVDVSRLEFDTRETSVFRDEEAALAKLRQGISEMAAERAGENLELVRELGRRKTADFVIGWLGESFGDGERYGVEVLFADELPAVAPLERNLD